LVAIALFVVAAPARAKPLLDCPLRDAPFSTQSPLMDILLNARARAFADKAMTGLAGDLPPQFMGTTTPRFASILTLKAAYGFLGLPSLDLAAIDRDLASIPVADAGSVSRWARYDA
jgi:hypothetical protein